MYSDMKEWDLHKYQIVVCYSPLDVKSLQESYPDFQQKDIKFLAFGPATAKALKDAGIEVEITAPTPEAPSVAQALLLYLEKNK
jgi:uroporphyrinogen-III synthase